AVDHLRDSPYTEIAETLAMSPAAVRQNISRARKRLITLLDL
ncbi:sigma factor-like helix-turn-helix DNA-binding protein, partial [Streptomyces ipomoeae]